MLIRILLFITIIFAALSATAGSNPTSRYLRFDSSRNHPYATYQTGLLSLAEHNQLTGSDNYKKEAKLYPFAQSLIFAQHPPDRDEHFPKAVSLKACSENRNYLGHSYEYVSLSAESQPVQKPVKPSCSQLVFSDGRELYFDEIPSPYRESIDGLTIIELSKDSSSPSSPEQGSIPLLPLASGAYSRLSDILGGGGGGAGSDDDQDGKPRRGFFGGGKQQDFFVVGLVPVLEPIAEQIENEENSASRLRLSTSLDDSQIKVLLRDDDGQLYIRTYSKEFIEWELGISVDPSTLPASLPMLTVNQGADGLDGLNEELIESVSSFRVKLLASNLGKPRACSDRPPGSSGATFSSKPGSSSSEGSSGKKKRKFIFAAGKKNKKGQGDDPDENKPAFPCLSCEMTFGSNDKLQEHRRSVHPTAAELCLDLQPGLAEILQGLIYQDSFSFAWIYPYLVQQLPTTTPHALGSFAHEFTEVISSEKTINEIIDELVIILDKRAVADWREKIFRSLLTLSGDSKRKTQHVGDTVKAYLREHGMDVGSRPWNFPLHAYRPAVTHSGELQRGQVTGIESAYQHFAKYFADEYDSGFTFSKQELDELFRHVVQALSLNSLLGVEDPIRLVSDFKQLSVNKNYTMGDIIGLINDKLIINDTLFFAGLFMAWDNLGMELQVFLRSFIKEEKRQLKTYYDNTDLERRLGILHHFLLLFTQSYWPGQDVPDFNSMLVQKAASEPSGESGTDEPEESSHEEDEDDEEEVKSKPASHTHPQANFAASSDSDSEQFESDDNSHLPETREFFAHLGTLPRPRGILRNQSPGTYEKIEYILDALETKEIQVKDTRHSLVRILGEDLKPSTSPDKNKEAYMRLMNALPYYWSAIKAVEFLREFNLNSEAEDVITQVANNWVSRVLYENKGKLVTIIELDEAVLSNVWKAATGEKPESINFASFETLMNTPGKGYPVLKDILERWYDETDAEGETELKLEEIIRRIMAPLSVDGLLPEELKTADDETVTLVSISDDQNLEELTLHGIYDKIWVANQEMVIPRWVMLHEPTGFYPFGLQQILKNLRLPPGTTVRSTKHLFDILNSSRKTLYDYPKQSSKYTFECHQMLPTLQLNVVTSRAVQIYRKYRRALRKILNEHEAEVKELIREHNLHRYEGQQSEIETTRELDNVILEILMLRGTVRWFNLVDGMTKFGGSQARSYRFFFYTDLMPEQGQKFTETIPPSEIVSPKASTPKKLRKKLGIGKGKHAAEEPKQNASQDILARREQILAGIDWTHFEPYVKELYFTKQHGDTVTGTDFINLLVDNSDTNSMLTLWNEIHGKEFTRYNQAEKSNNEKLKYLHKHAKWYEYYTDCTTPFNQQRMKEMNEFFSTCTLRGGKYARLFLEIVDKVNKAPKQ